MNHVIATKLVAVHQIASAVHTATSKMESRDDHVQLLDAVRATKEMLNFTFLWASTQPEDPADPESLGNSDLEFLNAAIALTCSALRYIYAGMHADYLKGLAALMADSSASTIYDRIGCMPASTEEWLASEFRKFTDMLSNHIEYDETRSGSWMDSHIKALAAHMVELFAAREGRAASKFSIKRWHTFSRNLGKKNAMLMLGLDVLATEPKGPHYLYASELWNRTVRAGSSSSSAAGPVDTISPGIAVG